MNIVTKHRLSLGLTIPEYADRVKVSIPTLVKIDAGDKVTKLIAARIHTTTGLSLEDVIKEIC